MLRCKRVPLLTLTPSGSVASCTFTLCCRLSHESRQRGQCRPEDPHLRRRFSVTCWTTNKLTRRFDIFGIPPQSMSTNTLQKGQKLVEDPRDIIETARLTVQEKNADEIF